MSPITIAIAGATGLLGRPLTMTLLSRAYHPSKFSKVIILTRDPTSAKAKSLTGLGAEAVQATDESVSAADLKGVDVLVNCLKGDTSLDVNNHYAKAAAEAGVKVYFPPEFGIDLRVLDAFVHKYFTARKAHVEYAKKIGGDHMKVISVSTGGFLDIAFGPHFGFDTANNVFSSFGDPAVRGTYTSLQDISLSIAQLSILATEDPNSVPDHVRVMGDCKSPKEIADLFGKESGETIAVKGEDYTKKKEQIDTLSKGEGYLLEYLRLIFASGTLDWISDNNNELVNPGEKLWQWKTIADVAKETKGKPVYSW